MSVFGLGSKAKVEPSSNDKKAAEVKSAVKNVQSDEAKAMLAKMAAKKDAGDCPFC